MKFFNESQGLGRCLVRIFAANSVRSSRTKIRQFAANNPPLEIWSKRQNLIDMGTPYELPNSLKVKRGQPLSPHFTPFRTDGRTDRRTIASGPQSPTLRVRRERIS